MARGDTEFCRLETDFVLIDPRFLTLSPVARSVYLYFWATCVRNRTEIISPDQTPIYVASAQHLPVKETQAAYEQLTRNGLVKRARNGALLIVGVKDKHQKLSGWKHPHMGNVSGGYGEDTPPISAPFDPDNRPIRGESKRKSKSYTKTSTLKITNLKNNFGAKPDKIDDVLNPQSSQDQHPPNPSPRTVACSKSTLPSTNGTAWKGEVAKIAGKRGIPAGDIARIVAYVAGKPDSEIKKTRAAYGVTVVESYPACMDTIAADEQAEKKSADKKAAADELSEAKRKLDQAALELGQAHLGKRCMVFYPNGATFVGAFDQNEPWIFRRDTGQTVVAREFVSEHCKIEELKNARA